MSYWEIRLGNALAVRIFFEEVFLSKGWFRGRDFVLLLSFPY